MKILALVAAIGLLCATSGRAETPAASPYSWTAPERAARVGELLPGRRVPDLTPETLLAEWTAAQIARWHQDHPALPPAEALVQYAAAVPTDAALTADFPTHIAPFGRVKSGRAPGSQAEDVLIRYCPFCGSQSMSLGYDPQHEYHATTTCCHTDLYGREQDCPADYALRPTTKGRFRHLDDTWVEVPCTVYRAKDGVEWELFIKTIFDQRRWLKLGCERVAEYGRRFEDTANPVYAHKLAVLLDVVADVYYGLPLCYRNELANGKDGQPLTRAEWEAVPRPAIFKVSYLGPWNRRTPIFNRGWINMSGEDIWVEPFAMVRHHPAFKAYSQQRYGDPDALDRKVRQKLLREVALMYESVFSQKLLTNYQEANYIGLWLLGVLTEDRVLIDFAGPNQELAMYNHTYQDGLNGEGAPNYMAMPGGYFYPVLKDPNGWLRYYPTFLEDNPFYWSAASEMYRVKTVRGMALEYGDQHEYAWPPNLVTSPEQLRENERLGSRNWAGYGIGLLRVGGPGHRQEVGLGYTRASLHNAKDSLSIECWVDGVPVLRKGGYSAYWCNARLQWDRPEYQALQTLGYPYPIQEGETAFSGWSWLYSHSPLCQNNTTVNDVATGAGWADNRGYGEVLCFKGGEPQGTPGSGFQVLDVKDHYSFERVGQEVSDFRRTLLGVEGPDGRPYVLDLLKLNGGQTQTLFSSAWGRRASDSLESGKPDPTLVDTLFGGQLPDDSPDWRVYEHVQEVRRAKPNGATWDVTWQTDLAALAPRDLDGSFRRPLPEGVGQVRLRLVSVDTSGGQAQLLSARGPWIGWLKQPLPGGQRVDGNVAFEGSRDFLIERRAATGDDPLNSLFVRVLEGYREGEQSALTTVAALPVKQLGGAPRNVVALALTTTAGHTDTVVYQSAPGTLKLPDGTVTDARYLLLRRDAKGEVATVEACRATTVDAPGFKATLPGDFTGTLTDLVGDLTGTRRESALILKPDQPWPLGSALAGKQLLVRYESKLREPSREGYRVEQVRELPGGLVRVDLQDHAPLAVSWHQVTELDPAKPKVIRTNRPMVDHGNSPWYDGLHIWFPERDRTYTIASTAEVGGGVGGDYLEVHEDVDLAKEGISVGDWYVIYGLQPGLQVEVANDFCWRREPATEGIVHSLKATGPVKLETSATALPCWWQAGAGAWQSAAGGKATFTATETAAAVTILNGKPAWLELQDNAPPVVQSIQLDGRLLTTDEAADVGWLENPRQLTIVVTDAANPLDATSLTVQLNGSTVAAKAAASDDGRTLTVTLDLPAILPDRPQRNQVELTVADRSIGRWSTTAHVSFINRTEAVGNARYLSDLKPVKAFAHGGVQNNRDYVGNPAEIGRQIYPKCLTMCPEATAERPQAYAIYELPANLDLHLFRAEIGISSSSGGRGSAVFTVESGATADGPWQVLYTSPIVRGGTDSTPVELKLGTAQFLRLSTGDAGDGINSDHAVWGGALME